MANYLFGTPVEESSHIVTPWKKKKHFKGFNQNEHLMPGWAPTYKHSSKNIYLWVDKSENVYLIST